MKETTHKRHLKMQQPQQDLAPLRQHPQHPAHQQQTHPQHPAHQQQNNRLSQVQYL
jgi:hypothetical protein